MQAVGKENQNTGKENPNYFLPRIEPFQRFAPTLSQNGQKAKNSLSLSASPEPSHFVATPLE